MKRLSFLFSFLLLSSLAWGATYYVDATGGADGNTGLATDNAWQTISKVNGSSFFAGDFILFKKGETWREQLTVPSSGSSGSVITFGSYGSGAAPIITGFDVLETWTQLAGAGDYAGNLVDDNFDDGDYTGWTASGSPTVATDFPHNGSYSAQFNASEYLYRTVTASGELYVALWFYTGDTTPAASQVVIDVYYGATVAASLYIESDGTLAVWDQDFLAAGTTALQDNTWAHLEMRIKKGDATHGQVQVWMNEAELVNASNRNVGNTDFDVVRFGSIGRIPNAPLYMDEVKIDNAARIGATAATNYWYKTHTASDGGIVLEDGSPMSFVEWDTDAPTSFGGKSAPASTFDPTGNRVYIWCTGNANPTTKTIQVSLREHGFALDAKNNVTISNLDFTGAYLHGGHVTGTNDNIILSGDKFYYNGGQWSGSIYLGNGFEVNGGATNIELNNVQAYQNFDAGLSVQMLNGNGNLDGVVIDNALCYQNRAMGIEILASSGTGTMSNITVKNSTMRNNDGTGWSGTNVNESGLYVDSYIAAHMSGIQAQYNLIYGNGIHGVYVLKNSTGNVPVSLYNNVIYNNGIGVVNTGALTFKNNIVAENSNGEIDSSTTITSDYNLFYHSGGGTPYTYNSVAYNWADWLTNSSQDGNSPTPTDPLFVSTVTPDFRVKAQSPAINAGLDVGLTTDYRGRVVPVGAAPDIGAYEFSPGDPGFGGTYRGRMGIHWMW
jgi:hypothetical protein